MRAFAPAALVLFLGALPACSGRHAESVVAAGSTSVQPYAEILAEEYMALHPGEFIDIQGGGSSAGITAAESGTADIGMSSRSLKESEGHLWMVEIAKDGLAVIVHPENPIGDLSLAQVRGIYAAGIANWSELGGPDAKIHVITREEGSGTRSAFEELVMGEAGITPKAIVQSANGSVRQLVAGDRHSIGFISLGLVDDPEIRVKAVRLEGVEAARENVVSGSYPLYRSFLFVAREEPSGPAGQFIDFIFSAEGRR